MAQSVAEGRTVRVRTVVAAVLVILALVFIVQNTSSRRVHFLFWSMSLPTWIWLLVIFIVGMVAGSVFPWLRKKRAR
jgi:uncharacterized integral membrane protein